MTLTKVGSTKTRSSSTPIETLDITVLAGGPGTEREVSLDGGQAVYEALGRVGHRVSLSDIGPEDLSALDRPTDFFFIVLHGEFGEDGTVQAELDARGLPYAGSGATASRIAMDKAESKRRFEQAGIPTAGYEVVGQDGLAGLTSRFSLPVVVKPVASGSSVDTTIAGSSAELTEAVSGVVERYGEALVEDYIDGPELTVGILDDQALPVCEIRTNRQFYDYQAKYLDDDTEYLFDLDLPSALLEWTQSLSLQAHRVLGCEVFSRVDWMVDAATMKPYVLEINTIPGFTSHSLLPKSAARIGLSFDQFCQQIVQLSLARGQD